MSAELQIPKPYAETRELPEKIAGGPIAPMLRVYKDAPGTILIQFRTHGATNYNGTGTKRNMLSGASLTRDEAILLRDRLNAFIELGV